MNPSLQLARGGLDIVFASETQPYNKSIGLKNKA